MEIVTDNLNHPDVFDLSPEQFEQFLSITAQKVVQEAWDSGLYKSYPGQEKNTFVHEYKDGSKEIVKFDVETGKEQVIKKRD